MSEESDNSNEKINWTVYSIPKFNEEFKQWEIEITQPTGEKSKQLFPTENDAKNFIKDKLPIEKEFELNDSQKKIVLDRWNDKTKPPPSIKELTELNFPGKDGRDFQGKATKKYIGELGLSKEIRTNCIPRNKSDDIILTDEQKKFLENNCPPMSAAEAARVLSGDNKLNNRNALTIVINNHLKTLNKTVMAFGEDIPLTGDYKPPRTQEDILKRINRYERDGIDKDKITAHHRKNFDALISHLHNLRFINIASTYDKQSLRDLFESIFVRHVWDKASELTNEEIDVYVLIAEQGVEAIRTKDRMEALQRMLDDATSDAKDDDKKKISMSLVEAIGKLSEKHSESIKIQKQLLNDVTVKRSDRLKNRIMENASVLNLVEMWKTEESRANMVRLAQMRQELVKNEFDKLTSMEEIKARIMGVSLQDVLDG